MNNQVSVSIDVADLELAVDFYTNALGCKQKTQYTDKWQVVTLGNLDLHIQEKEAGTTAAGDDVRRYDRHWTPVHLDFGVADVRQACDVVQRHGGVIESQSFSDSADIAVCSDPFGNGFCLIRE